MAHIWIRRNEVWRAQVIVSDELALTAEFLRGSDPAAVAAESFPRIKRFSNTDAAEEWLLIAPPRSVRINGVIDPLGCRLLRDRDEIQIPGFESVYFSTECLPRVEGYPGSDRPVYCPRCREPLSAGTPAVRCPGCSTWYHQTPEKPCWDYSAACLLCLQPSAITDKYRWTPEEAG